MSEDYEDLLDQNVDEAEKSIRDLEDPDYEQLLELEKEGKDRKTIKEFLEKKIETQTEEVVEEIEEETEGGFIGSFTREQVLAGGVIAGVLIGLLLGLAVNMNNNSGNAAEVRDSMNQLFEATGSQPDSITVTPDNGMYLVTVNSTVETQNGTTRSASQRYYVSPNGEIMFLTRSRLGTQTYFNVDDVIQRAQQQQQNRTTTNQTQ